MKSLLSVLLSLFIALSSLFGGASTVVPNEDSTLPYDGNEIVSVIVELDVSGLLEGINSAAQRRNLIGSFLESEKYEKIKAAQEKAKELIKESFSAADFENSFSYCFVTDGFSLKIPYKYVDDIEKLPGVKSVSLSTNFAKPETADKTDGDKIMLQQAGKFTSVPEAQKLGYTGKGVVVAVLDDGFELSHEAFDFEVEGARLSKKDIDRMTTFKVLNTLVPRWGANYYSQKIPYKWDYAEIDKTVGNEFSGHGTHVAGIIGGKSDVITGVAPDAQLLCMKVFGDEVDYAEGIDLLAALDDAVKLGADVVNMSLGSPSGQEPDNIFISSVLKKLKKAGVAVVCAAGNEASMGENDATAGTTTVSADLFDYGTVGSPSSYEWCMSVASSAVNESTSSSSQSVSVDGIGSAEMSSFSSWGVTGDMRLKPEITTPGSDIFSAIPDDSYGYMSGTSMASPYYAGSFALIKQYISEKYPSLEKKTSSELVNSLLMSTATAFKGKGQPTYYSPRRQGAGLVNLDSALKSKAYLTNASGDRPILNLGEDTDGTLKMSFTVNNMSNEELSYKLSVAPLSDSYKTVDGKYINTLTAKKLKNKDYTVEYTEGVNDDGTVTVGANGKTTVTLTLNIKESFIEKQKTAFKNGFFLDGFIFLKSENEPTLSLPYMAFYGDWDTPMLFDNTIYDSEPAYLDGQWGLMVTDGYEYYPLGVNMFEEDKQYNIDPKYCAFSENAFDGYLEDPYVTVSLGLLRNAKRMDFNLFTQSGIFRYCGSTLFDYCTKTDFPYEPYTGILWGGSGLIDGNSYVYKVSTTARNYKSGKVTLEFPFVVDNESAVIESCTYEKVGNDNILKIKIKDNRYVMGFEVYSSYLDTIADVSFAGIDPIDGTYEYTLNVTEAAGDDFDESDLEDIEICVLDYAYNETYAYISLSSGLSTEFSAQAKMPEAVKSYSFTPAQPVVEGGSGFKTVYSGPFSKIINSLQDAIN